MHGWYAAIGQMVCVFIEPLICFHRGTSFSTCFSYTKYKKEEGSIWRDCRNYKFVDKYIPRAPSCTIVVIMAVVNNDEDDDDDDDDGGGSGVGGVEGEEKKKEDDFLIFM